MRWRRWYHDNDLMTKARARELVDAVVAAANDHTACGSLVTNDQSYRLLSVRCGTLTVGLIMEMTDTVRPGTTIRGAVDFKGPYDEDIVIYCEDLTSTQRKELMDLFNRYDPIRPKKPSGVSKFIECATGTS